MRLIDVLLLEESKQIEYFKYLDIVKPIYEFKFRFKKYKYKKIVKFSFKDVDYIRRLLSDSDFDSIIKAFSLIFGIKENKIHKIKFSYFISGLRAIRLEIEHINKEEEKLNFFTSQKVKMALKQSNSEVMNQFSIYNQIEGLAKGDKTKWEYFENLEYEIIKFMLTFDAVGNDFNNRFQENYNRINKHIK